MRVLSNTPRPLAALEAWIRARKYRDKHGGPLLIIDEHGDPILDKRGRPRPFRLAIVASGGALSGVFQAGMFAELEAQGFNGDAVGYYIVSAAVSNTLAFISGCAYKAPPFYVELVTKMNEFIKFHRIWGPRMRLRAEVVDPMIKMLDLPRLRACRTPIYTAVTEWDTGKGWVVRLKVEEDPSVWVDVAQAAMTIPNLSPPVTLSGIDPKDPKHAAKCLDGALSLPLPLGNAVRQVRPSHVLVLGTRPLLQEVPLREMQLYTWMTHAGLWNAPEPIKRGMLMMELGVDDTLKRMRKINPRIECTALFPKAGDTIPPFPVPWFITIDEQQARNAGENGKLLMRECLDRAHMAIKRHSDDVPAA